MSTPRRITIPREKVVAYGTDGEVSRVAWFRHEPEFSVEFHISNRPAHLRDDAMFGVCRAVTIGGAGQVWICDCPGGVELHSRTPTYHDADAGPDFEHCSALRGPCWHDGSSLAASEFAAGWSGDDESVWMLLEQWVRSENSSRQEAQR